SDLLSNFRDGSLYQFYSGISIRRFGINAQHGLGAGWSYHHPTIIRQNELKTVQQVYFLHRMRPKYYKSIRLALSHNALLFGLRQFQIAALKGKRTDNSINLIDYHASGFSGFCHKFPNDEPHPDPISFRNVAFHRNTSRFFPSDQYIFDAH